MSNCFFFSSYWSNQLSRSRELILSRTSRSFVQREQDSPAGCLSCVFSWSATGSLGWWMCLQFPDIASHDFWPLSGWSKFRQYLLLPSGTTSERTANVASNSRCLVLLHLQICSTGDPEPQFNITNSNNVFFCSRRAAPVYDAASHSQIVKNTSNSFQL